MSAKHQEMAEWYQRAQEEILDSMDEELEMELDDDRLSADSGTTSSVSRQTYFKELFRLQGELVKLQDYVVAHKLKVAILFEGRDSAGKGGAIKRITQRLNPRVCRVVALPAPNEREKTQWYFQRYISQLPAGGEIALFDRSWYNRAGVERVMGFCTDAQYKQFMGTVNEFESLLVGSGIQILKYYLDITKAEQAHRLLERKQDPLKQWKISPIDELAQKKWHAYSVARDLMLKQTTSKLAPWTVVNANDKKLTHLNLIRDLLSRVEYPGKNKALLKTDPQIVMPYLAGSIKPPKLAP